jgi:hypothetical protein
MDSDTVLTIGNTDEAINRWQNYMQCQDDDGENRVSFSNASDESNDDHEEVKALRAGLKEKDQSLSALQSKFDSFSVLIPRSHPLERRPAALAAHPRGPGG